MTFKDFIEKFADAVEIEDISILDGSTRFRDLNDWNSLAALSVISMFDEELDKELTVTDFKKAQTLEDLFILANN